LVLPMPLELLRLRRFVLKMLSPSDVLVLGVLGYVGLPRFGVGAGRQQREQQARDDQGSK
jgi:hypothetical protein